LSTLFFEKNKKFFGAAGSGWLLYNSYRDMKIINSSEASWDCKSDTAKKIHIVI